MSSYLLLLSAKPVPTFNSREQNGVSERLDDFLKMTELIRIRSGARTAVFRLSGFFLFICLVFLLIAAGARPSFN